ncbi:hypothetical protein [Streptomyces sp. NPDC053427]|uniref:hypothetical protein n=1 Tax=Streptomyces sp. NPDC053427 TaxID=3365701 RepID=UPI0037CEB83C
MLPESSENPAVRASRPQDPGPTLAAPPVSGLATPSRLAASRAPDARPLADMPLSYTAFCTLRRDVYIRYASARAGCRRVGQELVQAALRDLATVWLQALQSASPAAVSWGLLAHRTAAGTRDQGGGGLHRILPRRQADALVLRYRLGLSMDQAADLMGIGDREMAGVLRSAMRRMAHPAPFPLSYART